MTRPAAVSFDVDGTLYPVGWRLLLRAAVRPGALRTLRLVKRARERLRGRDFPDGTALAGALATELGALAGMDAAAARTLVATLRTRHWPALLHGLVPAATRRALEELAAAGTPLAAFSDHDVEVKLQALGVRPLFAVVVNAEDEGAYKPHPRGFLAVAARLGVPAAAVLHVGDRADTDVAGALAAGMRAALVGPGAPGDAQIVAPTVSVLVRRLLAPPD
ncbi:MAG: HAD family hydrolase [Deltaproteobacteria bacterium]|nr:HAD family hydrolase [Deltaproteobacteria bacterium]